MATKNDILKEHLAAWLAARGDKKQRGEMARHLCFVTGVHPKSVPRSFKRLQMHDSGTPECRGRRTRYTPDVIAALKEIWETASEPCGENLHAVIGEYVQTLTRDGKWKHGDTATKKLLAMSLGLVKKQVAKFSRRCFLAHGKSTTKPGAIHTLIPVRTGPWNEAPVGTVQIDTVAHCGGTTAGDYALTVNAADVRPPSGVRVAPSGTRDRK